ncbi:MAG: hypothetical protein R3F51_13315 [Cyanobacteriota/Melainabacteria group bacterium]
MPTKYVAYTVKPPAHQLSGPAVYLAELKKLYGSHSPDKSGMIEAAISAWLKRWTDRSKRSFCKNFLIFARTP